MKNNSQIERGFEALTNKLSSVLNPPLNDPSQKPLKDSLDKAFETLRTTFKGEFGKASAIPDEEMVNIIQMAFVWYQKITSVDEAISHIKHNLDPHVRNGIKRVAENQWVIENVDALKGISSMLTERYRTLDFKR